MICFGFIPEALWLVDYNIFYLFFGEYQSLDRITRHTKVLREYVFNAQLNICNSFVRFENDITTGNIRHYIYESVCFQELPQYGHGNSIFATYINPAQ